MPSVIAFLNAKGGVGKTTLAVHVARALARDSSVLLIDSDPQGSARDWHTLTEGPAPFPVIGIDRPTIDKDIKSISDGYQYVVIDGAAKLEKMLASAVKAAQLIVIPITASPLDVWAANQLVELIQARQAVTDGLPAAGFMLNRVRKNTTLAREVGRAISEHGLQRFDGAIHDRQLFAQSMNDGKTVLDSGQSGQAAWEINHLTRQIVGAFDE